MEKLSKAKCQEIANKLLANEVLILPTDTIYGLSLLAKDGGDPIVLNSLKKADLYKPVIVLINKFKAIKDKVIYSKEDLKILKSKTPTTVIFQLKNSDKTIAIRICKRKDIKKIIKKVGPIYSTSVNLSGKQPLTTHKEMIDFLKKPENVYWVGPLSAQPSKIYNTITKKWER